MYCNLLICAVRFE